MVPELVDQLLYTAKKNDFDTNGLRLATTRAGDQDYRWVNDREGRLTPKSGAAWPANVDQGGRRHSRAHRLDEGSMPTVRRPRFDERLY
jgi:hypothetical protein